MSDTLTPAITIQDECGTENDMPVPVEMDGVTYQVTLFNVEVHTWQVLAIPEPDVTLEPDTAAGWGYHHSGREVSILVFRESFTDVPCTEEGAPEAPITTLPATGFDSTAFILGTAIVVAGLITTLVVSLRRRAQEEADRESEA